MRPVVFRARALARAASLAAALVLAGCSLFGGSQAPDDNAALLEQMREIQAERHTADKGSPAPKEPTLEDRLREGDRLRQSGDLARALWAYLRAHAIDPEDPRPRARIGAVRLQIDPKRAEDIFRELSKSTGGSALARTGLGLALIARQQWAPAIVELRAAVEKDGRLAVAHDALGVALERSGDVAGARESYRRAASLSPRSHEPLNNLGVSYLRTGEFGAAASALDAAARIEPRDPAVSNNLGLALGRLRRYDDALSAFRRATSSEQAALNNLGYVRYLNGDYGGALEVYERALLAPGTSEQRLSVLRNLRAAKRAQEGGAPAPHAGDFDAGLEGPGAALPAAAETPAAAPPVEPGPGRVPAPAPSQAAPPASAGDPAGGW
jgi:Flp pilus assembly protein TadD